MTDRSPTPAQVAVKPLLPCPFCGTSEMLRRIGANPGDGWGFVRCDYCDAEGPDPDNLPGGWNARAVPAMPDDVAGLCGALRSGEQADMDGCRVKVSRQACEEGADTIEALATEVARLTEELARKDATLTEQAKPLVWGQSVLAEIERRIALASTALAQPADDSHGEDRT